MFAVSGIAVLLFLGGWNTGFCPCELIDASARLGIPGVGFSAT